MPKDVARSLARFITASEGSEAWKRLDAWIVENLPNAASGMLISEILTEEIERLRRNYAIVKRWHHEAIVEIEKLEREDNA